MSGGHLTEYSGGLYQLGDWADKIDPQNHLLAELLRDTRTLLERYDYWMSGDTGCESVANAWNSFRDKWLADDPDHISALLGERMETVMESFRRGYVTEDP